MPTAYPLGWTQKDAQSSGRPVAGTGFVERVRDPFVFTSREQANPRKDFAHPVARIEDFECAIRLACHFVGPDEFSHAGCVNLGHSV